MKQNNSRLQKDTKQKPERYAAFTLPAALTLCLFIITSLPALAAAASSGSANTLILPLKINAHISTISEVTEQADKSLTELASGAGDELFTIKRSISSKAFNYSSSWPPPLSKLKNYPDTRKAQYIVAGTLTQLGNRYAIDLTLYDLSETSLPKYFYNDGEINKGIKVLLASMTEEILAYTNRHIRYAEITVGGNKRIDSGAILRKIKSKAGDRYNVDLLNQDLHEIFQMGYFNDVQIQRADTDTGIKIKFAIIEKEVVGKVNIVGEDKIDNDDIEEVITISPNSIINPKEVRNSINNIQKLYKDKGFYRTEITHKLTHPDEDTVDVDFIIKEGYKAYIEDIVISGNNSYSKKELQEIMMTKERGFFSWLTDSGILKRDLVDQDAARINAFYQNNGYIDVRVGKPEIEQKEKSIYITIPIEEGKRYRVGELDVVGDLIKDKGTLLAQTKSGDEVFFSRETLHKDLLALTDYYAANGYAYAEVTPSTQKDVAHQRLNITFNITKGPLVQIDRIVIKGNDRTRDKVIRRSMKLKEGEIFNATNIKKSQENLQRLGFFEEANVTPRPTADEKIMNIEVDVKEKPTGTFSIGAGYSSVDNLMFMGEISQNNFRGLGQQLTLQANVSGSNSRYNFSFTEPHLNDSNLLFGIDVYNWLREYDDYDRRANGYGLRFGYPIWNKWRLFWGYGWDNTTLSNVSDTASELITDSQDINTTSAIKLGVSKDTRNRHYGASKGARHSITTKYAGGDLGGDAQFTKIEAVTSWYFPVIWDTVFHWKLSGGQVIDNADDKLPVFERFYLGGLSTVRGFKNGQISPRDPISNEKIGGTTMWFTNFEYIFPLIKDAGLNGLIFFDAGNVYDIDNNWEFRSIRKSIGYGFRWMSPMGPLRLEWGRNLDPEPDEIRSNWDFSIGGSF